MLIVRRLADLVRRCAAPGAALAVGLAAPLAAGPAAAAPVVVAPLHYSFRQLPNGLKVYAAPDPSTATVAVQVWYDVGGKNDPRDRSGFAHLFEHLMFKATRNLPSESFDRLTEDVGGFNNAYTNEDNTVYYEVVPAHHLRPVLWAEAERMGALVVDEAGFRSERDVVKEEYRQSVLARPYGALFSLLLPEISNTVSPYGRPVIGSIADLDAASLADVRAFHALYYRPDNATLVVVGNFDPARLDAWVDSYFGAIPRPAFPIPRATAVEPPRTGVKIWTEHQPNTPLPAVLLSYAAPAASSPDAPALMIADALLTRGESSRLYRSLVYEARLAHDVSSDLTLRQQPSAYAVTAIVAEGRSMDEASAALRREVGRLAREPAAAAELDRVRTILITDLLRSRETAAGRASALGQAAVVGGDPTLVDRVIPALQAVTAADVQRVAARYLVDDTRAEIRYLSDDKTAAPAALRGPSPDIALSALVAPAGVAVVEPAPPGQRVAPPAPSQPAPFAPPSPLDHRLANGLRVIVAPDHRTPLVSLELVIDAGAAADPAGLSGAARLTAELVTRGAGPRTAPQVAADIEALGGDLSAGSGRDGSTLTLTLARNRLEQALPIFADVARRPTFAAEELDRQRQQDLDDLKVTLSRPGALASIAAARAVYGAAPYGRLEGGTAASLKALKPSDVIAFHAAHWTPDHATLVVAGDITDDESLALARTAFGDWAAKGAAAAPPVAPVAAAPAPRVLAIDLPDSGQAAVVVARLGAARSDPRYFEALVADTVLGGGYSARLNEEIRVKRGLSYGAGSRLEFRHAPGILLASAQTKNGSAVEVASRIEAEMRRLCDEPVGVAELDARKAALIGEFGRSAETTEGVSSLLGQMALLGAPLDGLAQYVERVQAVTPDAVRQVSQALLDPGSASIIVVGDGRQFVDGLKKAYPKTEVIPVAALDLDSPTLTK